MLHLLHYDDEVGVFDHSYPTKEMTEGIARRYDFGSGFFTAIGDVEKQKVECV